MSTDYRLYCLDCDDQQSIHANYLDHCRDTAPRIRWQWFAEHRGHRLRVISKYGEVDGQCAKDITCNVCGDVRHHACKLDAGHEPPCSAVPGKAKP